MRVPLGAWPVVGCVVLFAVLWICFWWSHRGKRCFYFDPQDFVYYEGGADRELPVAAVTSTFAPHLENYQSPRAGVFVAKIVLAFSILYGVVFSGLLQFFYDDYAQDVRAYTRGRYSLIEALGFSSLACFVAGYFVWAFNLG